MGIVEVPGMGVLTSPRIGGRGGTSMLLLLNTVPGLTAAGSLTLPKTAAL